MRSLIASWLITLVYEQFRKLAVKLKAKTAGAKAIWEVLRYELAINTTNSVKDYKLSNNHVGRMARARTRSPTTSPGSLSCAS